MFKHFARFSTSSETWVTGATRVTENPKPRKTAAFEPGLPVTQNENARATVGNQKQAVAQVTQTKEEWATEGNRQETVENSGFLVPVAQVTQVTQEYDKAGIAEWDAEDWQAYFDERAAIAEHDGGLERADAERQAFECCVMEWLWQHPPPASGPERCAHCGQPLGEPGRDGLPFLTGDGGHVWLHSGCHGDWTVRRRAEAVAALAALGLPTSPARSDSPHLIRRPALVPAGREPPP